MSPDSILNTGIVICAISVASTIVVVLLLRFVKKRLNKKFDLEYGKRRH